uniref:Transmembrane protein n=1 Tax=Steinernema glaseri TaxID=37863 RepID=A0A1I8AS16_9BILA
MMFAESVEASTTVWSLLQVASISIFTLAAACCSSAAVFCLKKKPTPVASPSPSRKELELGEKTIKVERTIRVDVHGKSEADTTGGNTAELNPPQLDAKPKTKADEKKRTIETQLSPKVALKKPQPEADDAKSQQTVECRKKKDFGSAESSDDGTAENPWKVASVIGKPKEKESPRYKRKSRLVDSKSCPKRSKSDLLLVA